MTDRAQQRVTIRRLSDPLASKGQRSHGPRIQQERSARALFAGIALGGALLTTGAIAMHDAISTDPPVAASTQSQPSNDHGTTRAATTRTRGS